jgi:galactonate dehydratase
VHTDEGRTGAGETRMPGRTDPLLGCLRETEANHVEADHIAGCAPVAVEDLVPRRKYRMKHGDYGRAGETMRPGIAVAKTACRDVKDGATASGKTASGAEGAR